MKKGKILVFILLIFGVISVKASGNFIVSCGNNEVRVGNQLTCDMVIMHFDVSMAEMEFEYASDLDIAFEGETGFNLNNNANKVNIESLTVLDISDADPIKVGTMNINVSDDFNTGEYLITFSNIQYKDVDSNPYTLDGFNKTITVSNEELDDDCTLTSITVNGVLVKNFSKDVYLYENIYVDSQIVFVDAVRSSTKSNVSGLGAFLVQTGKTVTRVVHVVAENGDLKDYVLKITNGIDESAETLADSNTLSSDNAIKEMELYNGKEKIAFDFLPGTTLYNVRLSDININKITIKATLNSNKASFVSKYGPRDVNINYGDNVYEVKVNAEDGTLRTYTIYILKEDVRSNDNTLYSLKVNDQVVSLENGVFNYEVSLDHDVEKTDIFAVANSNRAKIEYENIVLADGINEPVSIKVTAENGDLKEYNLQITRLPDEESVVDLKSIALESITIEGYDLDFNEDFYYYDITLKNNEEYLNILVNPAGIQNEITGNSNLQDGSVINIKVYVSDSERTYIINIHKLANENFNFVYYFVFGIGVITFIASVIYAIRIKKRK